MQDQPDLWIVSGPSCAGKSHLLASRRIREITSLAPESPVIFPRRRYPQLPPIGAYFHYNILRPLVRALERGTTFASEDFSSDLGWRAAVEIPARRRALILVASKQALRARVIRRKLIERGVDDRAYRTGKWLGIYDRIDLDAIYAAWRAELDRSRIPWIEIDAETEGFPELSRARAAP